MSSSISFSASAEGNTAIIPFVNGERRKNITKVIAPDNIPEPIEIVHERLAINEEPHINKKVAMVLKPI